MNREAVFISVATVCFCLTAGAAFAEENSEKVRSEKHFNAGLSLLATENFLVAAQEFESSVKLYPTKSGYFNLAICYYELRRYGDAVTTIEQLKKKFKDELNEQWQNEVATFEEKLRGSVVPVEFKTNIEGATISVDGKKVDDPSQPSPLLIGSGDHEVTITAEDYERISEVIKINAGQGKTVYHFLVVNTSDKKRKKQEAIVQKTTHPVHFKNEQEEEKSKRKPRIGTAIAFSVGGAAGIAAITTGVIHLVGVSNIRDSCENDVCEDLGMKSELTKMKKLGVATNVLIAVSATAVVTGTILAFVEGKPKQSKQKVSAFPSIWKGGGGLAVSGSF